MKVAILCPGKSLKETMPEDYSPYRLVIAVTDAVHAKVPFTHFTMTEVPTAGKKQHFRDRLDELAPIIVWGNGHKLHARRWKEWGLKKGVEIDTSYKVPGLIEALPYKTRVESPDADYAWSRGPTFFSIARSIVEGAEEIDVFGSDFHGKTNYHPVTGAELPGKKSYHDRWAGELKHFEDIAAEAQRAGILITRVLPGVDSGVSGSVVSEGAQG